MKFSVNLPLDHVHPEGEFQTPNAVREIAAALEKSNVAACRLTDHPAPSADWLHNTAGGHDALDPFAGLAFVAPLTTRIKLMTNIVVLPYRNPFIVAKAAATLQILSGGRFILGVGVGYQKVEFDALGVPFEQRGALMDEGLETLRLAWAGGPVIKRGRLFNATENEPRPIPSPPPPIWIGGGSDKAAERAARYGDAWDPVYFPVVEKNRVVSGAGVFSVAELGEKIIRVKARREELGRTGAFDFACSTPLFPKSRNRADTDQFLGALDELKATGITWFNTSLPCPSKAVYFENLAWLDEEILPHFPDPR